MTHLLSKFVLIATVLMTLHARAADLPDTLPYGTEGIPMTPITTVNITPTRTVDLLGGRISDPYLPARVTALTEIGRCQLPAGAPYLRKGLTDSDPQARAAAAAAAGKINDSSLTADLKPLLKDADATVRAAAVVSGAKLGDASFIDAGLADAEPAVVIAALSVATDAHKVMGVLTSAAPPVVIPAIRALGRIGDASAADAVIPFLSQPIPNRVAAIESLGQMKSTAHAADVMKFLTDPHPTVRRAALLALLNLVDADTLHGKAIAALADEDLPLREAAARVLTASPAPAAVLALVTNLSADSVRLHDAARAALIATGQPTIPAAQALLTDPNPRRREDGSYLLGRLKSDAGLDAHIALLNDADIPVVAQAADSLGRIGRREALPALNALAIKAETEKIESPLGPAMEQAIVACAEFGDSSILSMCKTLVPASTKYAANTRAAAVFAIGRLGDPADRQLPGMLSHPIGDMLEAGNVQLECVKALGQLKLKPALAIVGKTREEAKYTGDARVDWIDYWIRCRVTGEQPPLTPIETQWVVTSTMTSLDR